MTCDETRDSLSAYLDGALAPEERHDVEAHLATCAECVRELASLRQTVALLQRVQPARAPVGFVDRVVAAARPRPWYRRVADAIFAPALTKLPLQATAVLLVGLLAVYLFERTPELQQAARQDTPQRERVAPVPPPTVPAEPSATRTAPVAQAPAEPSPADRSPADRSKDKADEVADKADPATPLAEPSAPPAPPTAVGQQDRRDARLSREVGGEVAGAPPAASTPAPAAPAPPGGRETAPPPPQARSAPEPKQQTPAPSTPPEAENRMRLERSPDAARAPRAAPPALGAKRAAPAADVVARVAVKDRDAAERDLAELIARVGGTVAERRTEAETTVVEALIPQPRYAEFTDSVARIGAWRLEAERPDLPAQIRVILRLQ